MNIIVLAIIVIAILILWYLLTFYRAICKIRKKVLSNGGMKVIYKTLVDGLMQYSTASVIRDEDLCVIIAGIFTDPIIVRKCGKWSFIIRQTFTTVYIKYRANIDLIGVKPISKTWEFPVNKKQEDILSIIKEYADRSDIYCIFK